MARHLVEPPPAHRAPGGWGLLQVPAGETAWRDRAAVPPRRSARARATQGGSAGMGPGPLAAAVLSRRRDSLAAAASRSPPDQVQPSCWPPAPPAHSAPAARCSRTGARASPELLEAAGPPKKDSSAAQAQGSNARLGRASAVPAAGCGESTERCESLAVGPPEQPQGSRPKIVTSTDGWRWTAGVEIGGEQQGRHQETEPGPVPSPHRPSPAPTSAQRAEPAGPGGAVVGLRALRPFAASGCPVQHGGYTVPQNEAEGDCFSVRRPGSTRRQVSTVRFCDRPFPQPQQYKEFSFKPEKPVLWPRGPHCVYRWVNLTRH